MRILIKVTILIAMLTTLTSCGMSVDTVKTPIIKGLKTTLQTQNDITMSLVPNGDKTLHIDNKDVTVPGETFTGIKALINSNTAINKALVDIIGSQVTDANIATIIYYAQKVHIDPEKLLKTVAKE